MKTLEDPDLAVDLFRRDTGQSGASDFTSWEDGLMAFVHDLEMSARDSDLTLVRFDRPTQSTAQLLRRRDASANMWIARLQGIGTDDDWLLWLGFSTNRFNEASATSTCVPALFLSERDRSPNALYPYRSPHVSTRLSILEIVVTGRLGSNVTLRDEHGVRSRTSKAAAAELVGDIVLLRQ